MQALGAVSMEMSTRLFKEMLIKCRRRSWLIWKFQPTCSKKCCRNAGAGAGFDGNVNPPVQRNVSKMQAPGPVSREISTRLFKEMLRKCRHRSWLIWKFEPACSKKCSRNAGARGGFHGNFNPLVQRNASEMQASQLVDMEIPTRLFK